jgi:UDP-3-O-[3-hydroxymyristoyl] glucosamine N-acyltransferase
LAQVLALFESSLALNAGTHKTALVGKGTKIESGVQLGAYVVVGENCHIGKGTKIYPGVFIGDGVEIGENSCLFPNVAIYQNVKIGKGVRIHAGAVIGVDGYGFAPGKTGYTKIPQVGSVIIEDHVEIYANVCIARGTMGNTIIKEGTKIDNLTHIAHNCKIGKHCAITALVGFAGSVTFEDRVAVGGQAGFNGHITVGENTVVMGKAGVTKNIAKNSTVSGFPAIDHAEDLQIQAQVNRLPKLFQRMEVLEKRLNELEQK